MRFSTPSSLLLASVATLTADAFVVRPVSLTSSPASLSTTCWRAEGDDSKSAEAAVFLPEEQSDDDLLDKAEQLGRGASKVRL
jgi:hypothetical protein